MRMEIGGPMERMLGLKACYKCCMEGLAAAAGNFIPVYRQIFTMR